MQIFIASLKGLLILTAYSKIMTTIRGPFLALEKDSEIH